MQNTQAHTQEAPHIMGRTAVIDHLEHTRSNEIDSEGHVHFHNVQFVGDLTEIPGFATECRFDDVEFVGATLDRDTMVAMNERGFTGFHGVHLAYQTLEGGILKRPDIGIAGAVLANLSNVDLSQANLAGVNASHVRLDGANLDEVWAEKANFAHSSMEGISANRANFNGADFSGVNLSNSCLTNVCFDGATFDSNTNFSGCDLSGASFNNVKVRG